MLARPCFGPCDPSIVEWLAYAGLLLIAAGLATLAYIVARRPRAGQASSNLSSRGLMIAAIVLLVVVAPRWPRPAFAPAAVVAGLPGSGETDPFYLQGSYVVTWAAPCQFTAALYRGDDRTLVSELVSTASPSGASSNVDPLLGAAYYIHGNSGCEWRVTLTPRAEPN